MSDNTFWVNTDGLTPATSGFHEKANQLSDLAGQISDLISQIPQAAGGDKLGRDFAAQLTPQIGQLQQGVQSMADTLHQTGDGVDSMAKMLNATNNNASSNSRSLSNLLNSGQPLTPASFMPAEVGTPPSASGREQPLPAEFWPAQVETPPSGSDSGGQG
jgi:ABC-type transporter Mla subunit MlaD